MATPSFLLRERFHLLFVRFLAARLTGRAWAVKGGIGLRLFHRSPRLSEDLDADIAAGMRGDTVRRAVETVLAGRPLVAGLAAAGVAWIRATAVKQAATTQRWKVQLELATGGVLHTKLEFSRRLGKVAAVTGIPGAELLAAHDTPPFPVPHYDGLAMAVQKVQALAAPARHAPRDLFDLDHLLTSGGVSPEALRAAAGEDTAAKAADRAGGFTWQDFAGEVVPYLTDELVDAYRRPPAFQALRARVQSALGGG